MQTEGDNILHALDYLQRKRGSNGIEEIKSALNFDINDIQEERFYPFEWYLETLECVEKAVNKTGYSVAARIGYNRAQKVGFAKTFEGGSDPIPVLKKLRRNWGRYYDFGFIDLTVHDNNSADVSLHGFPQSYQFCERMNGFLKGLLRVMCNQEEATVSEAMCNRSDDDYCLFELTW
jgi:predicted hydrocarbon binding protein